MINSIPLILRPCGKISRTRHWLMARMSLDQQIKRQPDWVIAYENLLLPLIEKKKKPHLTLLQWSPTFFWWISLFDTPGSTALPTPQAVWALTPLTQPSPATCVLPLPTVEFDTLRSTVKRLHNRPSRSRSTGWWPLLYFNNQVRPECQVQRGWGCSPESHQRMYPEVLTRPVQKDSALRWKRWPSWYLW